MSAASQSKPTNQQHAPFRSPPPSPRDRRPRGRRPGRPVKAGCEIPGVDGVCDRENRVVGGARCERPRDSRAVVVASLFPAPFFSFTFLPYTHQTNFGQSLAIVADPTWADAPQELSWSEGDVWTGEAPPPVGEWKLVIVEAGAVVAWEDGPNRAPLDVTADTPATVTVAWGEPAPVAVEAAAGGDVAAAAAPVLSPPPAEAVTVAVATVGQVAEEEEPPAILSFTEESTDEDVPPPPQEPVSQPSPPRSAVVAAAALADSTPAPSPPPSFRLPRLADSPSADAALRAVGAAAALGVGAVVATALAVDAADVVVVGAMTAVGAALAGLGDGKKQEEEEEDEEK